MTVGRITPLVGACAALLFLAGAALIHAQQSSSDVPTFRSSADAVTLDVFVTDAAGRPVTDLNVGDFELLENGQAQPITTFASVQIPIDRPRGLVRNWVVPTDVRTNDRPPGRMYVFALDEIPAADALRTRAFIRTFLERFFGDGDVGAVVLVGRGLVTDGQPFTSDAHLLLTAAEKYSGGFGGKPTCAPSGMGSNQSTVTSADGNVSVVSVAELPSSNTGELGFGAFQKATSLRALTEALATMPGGRKTVLYFTNCIGFDAYDVADYRGGVLGRAAEEAHAAIAAATRANIVFYPLNPAGLSLGDLADGANPNGSGGIRRINERMDLRALAEVTGGFALTDSNSFLQTFERIRQENSVFYNLGFNSSYTRRNGRFVKVEVRVKRPGMTVRTRDGYVSDLSSTRKKNDDKEAASPALEALASPIATRGLTMRVFAAPYLGTGKDAAVALTVEIDPTTLSLSEKDGVFTGDLEISYTATDMKKNAYPGGRHAIALSLTQEAYDRARTKGLRMLSVLDLPKGQHQIRVGAAAGPMTGSVLHDVIVPDFTASPLTLSGLALTTSSAGGGVTLRPNPAVDKKGRPVKCSPPRCVVPLSEGQPSVEDPLRALPAPPLASRTFTRDQALIVFAEAYANTKATPSQKVSLTATLVRDGVKLKPLATDTRDLVAAASRQQRAAFTLNAPLRDVAPGPYVLLVEGRLASATGAAVARAIPIEVR